jgi:methyl farnesoate epoxidase/farnesoate epoxidase
VNLNGNPLIGVIIDFFIASAETISGSIGFALLYLLSNPEIQHRIHTELDGIAIGIGVNQKI